MPSGLIFTRPKMSLQTQTTGRDSWLKNSPCQALSLEAVALPLKNRGNPRNQFGPALSLAVAKNESPVFMPEGPLARQKDRKATNQNNMKTHILDLGFLGHKETIASFLIESSEGPVLVETGPHSTFGALTAGLARHAYRPEDIRHVFLTHIHFDHAGAAWAFAGLGAKIYVHPAGLPHLSAPEKLLGSARRIYGDDMDRLWGEIRPIPEKQLVAAGHGSTHDFGDMALQAWHTPGHASHHIAWQLGDTLFTGDVAGVKIGSGPPVPPCPPPDINLEQWQDSIKLIKALKPKTLFLTHFGAVTAIGPHLAELEKNLHSYAHWIKERLEAGENPETLTPAFDRFAKAELQKSGVGPEGQEQYQAANPAWMSVAGLARYWKKKAGEGH